MKSYSGWLLFGVLALTGCGSDPCEEAADHLDECGAAESSGSGSGEGECSGAAECAANCINDASCDDLKSTSLDSAYFKCIAACSGG